MATLKWIIFETIQTLINTAATLANNALAGSSAVANDTDLQLVCDFELYIPGVGVSINQGVRVAELYIVPSVDGGTNFADGHDASVTPQKAFLVGVFEKVSATGTGAMRMAMSGVPLPPFDYKVVIKNVCGQTWNANWLLYGRRYALQSV